MLRAARAWEVRMFGSLGIPELLILLAIVVLIFGVNKLPKLGKGLGEGIRNFKESVKSEKSDADKNEDSKPGNDAS
jgi:sec-independent protein translocase protein TatA